MADIDDVPSINLSDDDAEVIAKVVATEVPPGLLRRHQDAYSDMAGAVADTILNRLVDGRYGRTVREVVNAPSAFTKINGPKGRPIFPYGSVDKAPRASPIVRQIVDTHLARRSRGMASLIGGSRNYANPHVSSPKNLRAWVYPMIAAGAVKLGVEPAVHYHGTVPGQRPTPYYRVTTPSRFMPFVDPDALEIFGPLPIPTRRPSSPDELGRSFAAGLTSAMLRQQAQGGRQAMPSPAVPGVSGASGGLLGALFRMDLAPRGHRSRPQRSQRRP